MQKYLKTISGQSFQVRQHFNFYDKGELLVLIDN